MLPRGSPPASQERDDVAREIMLLPLVGHGLAPPRPPADVQWRACFGSTSRTIRPSCRPGGLPTATSTILGAAERLLCESCAAELARARPRVHARAATVHAHAADVLPLLSASCKIFCAYPPDTCVPFMSLSTVLPSLSRACLTPRAAEHKVQQPVFGRSRSGAYFVFAHARGSRETPPLPFGLAVARLVPKGRKRITSQVVTKRRMSFHRATACCPGFVIRRAQHKIRWSKLELLRPEFINHRISTA